MRRSRLGGNGFWLVSVLLLLLLLPSYLVAEDSEVYQISKTQLTQLENNLTQLNQELNQQKILCSQLESQLTIQKNLSDSLTIQLESQKALYSNLQIQLTNSQSSLEIANQSLTQLKDNINRELSSKIWTGIGIGAGLATLIILVVHIVRGN